MKGVVGKLRNWRKERSQSRFSEAIARPVRLLTPSLLTEERTDVFPGSISAEPCRRNRAHPSRKGAEGVGDPFAPVKSSLSTSSRDGRGRGEMVSSTVRAA